MSLVRTGGETGSLDGGIRLMSCRLSSRIVHLLEEETENGDGLLCQRLAALPSPKRVVSHNAAEAIDSCSVASRRGSAGDLLVLASAFAGELQKRHSQIKEPSQEAVASTPKTATTDATCVSLESSPSGHLLNGFWDFSAGVWALHEGGTCQSVPLFVAGVDSLAGRSGDVAREVLEQATLTALQSISSQFPEAPTEARQTDVNSLVESATCVCPSPLEIEDTQETFRDGTPAIRSGSES